MIINIITNSPFNEVDKDNLLSIREIEVTEFSNKGLWEENTLITQILVTSISSISLNVLSSILYDIIKNYQAKLNLNKKTISYSSKISKNEIIELIRKEIEEGNNNVDNT